MDKYVCVCMCMCKLCAEVLNATRVQQIRLKIRPIKKEKHPQTSVHCVVFHPRADTINKLSNEYLKARWVFCIEDFDMHGLVLCVRRPSGRVSILFLINTVSVPLFLHQRCFHLSFFFFYKLSLFCK